MLQPPYEPLTPHSATPQPGVPHPVGPDAPITPERVRIRIRPRWRRRLVPRLAGTAVLLFLIAVAWLAVTAPLSRSLRPIAPPQMTLLADDGTPIARRGAIIDKMVDVKKLPRHVGLAFVAIEDRRFYSHWGIDPRGIARAAWHNLRAGGVREGGSTITQQLSKVAFLDADRTAARKLREVLIAFWLEGWLTKDEILSRYLSNVYFGDNVYGLRAAARHYFDKRPEQLTISESALLAGLMKAPSRLAPTSNPQGARARQKLVIAAMRDGGFISASQARRARPAALHVRPIRFLPTGTYFADWAMPAARDRAGAVYAEQRVETTLDMRLQRAAERAVAHGGTGKLQIALVAMRPDGSVVAMVGGRSYQDSGFNRATQALRQPGSTFKLFVYLAALRAGMTPDDRIADTPLTIDGWSPQNSDRHYRGDISLREAFARSSNVAAVRLAQRVGIDTVIRAARDLGVRSPLSKRPSLALGTSGMTLLELTSAYAAVAADAYPVQPHGLPPQERGWFETLWDRPHHFGSDRRDMLLDLLSATVTQGTARGAALQTRVFGKTGTTQDNRDAIFIGFAGDLVTGVWIGNDDNSPLNGIAGGGLPARIWRDFMVTAIGSAPLARVPAVAPAVKADDDKDISVNTDLGDLTVGLHVGKDGLSVSAVPRGGAAQERDGDRPPPRDEPPDAVPPPDAPDEAERQE